MAEKNEGKGKGRKDKKKEREFDWSQQSRRQIALQVRAAWLHAHVVLMPRGERDRRVTLDPFKEKGTYMRVHA